MPKHLLMIRHAHAADGSPDISRTLTHLGEGRARALGDALRERAVSVDVALCSPAVRTRSTWALVRAAIAGPAATVVDDLYGASTGALLDVLRGVADDVQMLAIITHNPGVSEFVRGAADGDLALRRAFSPGDAVCLETDAASWVEAANGSFQAIWRV